MYESVNAQTDGRRLESHPISSQRAFCSGELKYKRLNRELDKREMSFTENIRTCKVKNETIGKE